MMNSFIKEVINFIYWTTANDILIKVAFEINFSG